ncbi:MAG TPA: helix-turn-helix transcriptional regulator, partial [Trebonia sp.]
MTVGQTLTEARAQAGLTVDELSERTRIRETVIRSIEQDDYEACGGDLYVRGYVRALAGAVGIDAQPLIREYELGRAGQTGARAAGSTGRHAKGYPAVAAPDAQTAFDLPAVTADAASDADLSATRFDLPQVTGDPAATAFDLPALPSVPPAAVPPAAAQPPGSADTRFDLPPVTENLTSAGYGPMPRTGPGQPGDSTAVMPALGGGQAPPHAFPGQPGAARFGPAQPGAPRKNRRVVVAAVAGGIAVAALGVIVISLVAGGTQARTAAGAGASAASAARASAAAQSSAAAASA